MVFIKTWLGSGFEPQVVRTCIIISGFDLTDETLAPSAVELTEKHYVNKKKYYFNSILSFIQRLNSNNNITRTY